MGKTLVLAADQTSPEQTTPTSPLPSPTATPTVTPTLLPDQLDCFLVSRLDATSMLLAWHIGQLITVTDFALWRATVISPTLHTGFVENSRLIPPMSPPAAQSLGSSVRYTTTDTGIEPGKSYVYRLDILGSSDQVLQQVTAYSPAPDSPPDDEICDPNRTSPTATPTSTIPPIIFPTSTPTPRNTSTPTWTPTATNSPTATWTPTPLPTNPPSPLPTATFTPIPTDTPLPPTDTPSPTFTVTPTFTPDIQPPTPAFANFETQTMDPGLPAPDQPPDTFQGPPLEQSASVAMPAPEGEQPSPAMLLMESQPAQETPIPTPASAEAAAQPVENPAAVAQIAQNEILPIYAVNEFRPRLLPGNRVLLFRYALVGVAGLAFFGALLFLVAGIGMRRD